VLEWIADQHALAMILGVRTQCFAARLNLLRIVRHRGDQCIPPSSTLRLNRGPDQSLVDPCFVGVFPAAEQDHLAQTQLDPVASDTGAAIEWDVRGGPDQKGALRAGTGCLEHEAARL
jgi:hypothetical protein